MVVKNRENPEKKDESKGKKFGLWIARIIVMFLFLYLAAVLFNYLPLLPIYGATYLPLDNRLFKAFNENSSTSESPIPQGPNRGVNNKNNKNNGVEMTSLKSQTGGGSSSPWGGNISDLIDLYKNVWKELKENKDMKFNLIGGTPNKTVGDLIANEKKNRSSNTGDKTRFKTQINAEDTTISNIIKNMLRNPATMKTIRDQMSKKSKHFFASIPITGALLKIAEFAGIAEIDANGLIKDDTNLGIYKGEKFKNPENKELSIAQLEVEQEGGTFAIKNVYDVNKFCTKNMLFWYLKQFFVLIGTTIGAIFMWPIYYLHEVEIIQGATVSETGKVEACNSGSGGKALYIIILILGLLFIAYNAYARCFSFFESFITIFKTGKTVNEIVLWISIIAGIGVSVIGFFLYKNFEQERVVASTLLKSSKKAGSQIPSMLSHQLLRGLIDHYGLIKSVIICFIGSVLLGSIWSMSLTGDWPLLAIFAFFFPIAGLILIYLTKSEMATLFIEKVNISTNSSKTKNNEALPFDLNDEHSEE